MSSTPAILNRRARTIARETELVLNRAIFADLNARKNGRPGTYIPTRVLEAHAREVATQAYDLAREREHHERVHSWGGSE